MTPLKPELSRPLQVDRVPALGSHETVVATEAERASIARRLDVPVIHALRARLHAQPWRGGLKLSGTVSAELDQVSVVSLEQFRSKVECQVERYFMPHRAHAATSEEEIDPIENGLIDLGEVVVETLALELDPYPRQPGEQFDPPDLNENTPKPHPFDSLKRLKQ